MTVGELRKDLEGVPDDAEVEIMSENHDDYVYNTVSAEADENGKTFYIFTA
ncbi:hypothetical protein [uncultured Desulfovibrio sp.]|uniref:hypothetical protein n=1 Tax=uncultured Desulfovibrio sp. TaxID=167968 RepID=UPI0026141C0F|nr:hypothetical protein [uncultured Desulfovibrio sp.]